MRSHIKAFPNAPYSDQGRQLDRGMELRDYFAAKAMQGLIDGKTWFPYGDSEVTYKDAARCYEIADAMMRARNNMGVENETT